MALVAELSSIIRFAGALPTSRFTVKPPGPIEMTFTRSTFRIAKVAKTATVTVGWSELDTTFTATCTLFTVPS
jgi:hypothetical protein